MFEKLEKRRKNFIKIPIIVAICMFVVTLLGGLISYLCTKEIMYLIIIFSIGFSSSFMTLFFIIFGLFKNYEFNITYKNETYNFVISGLSKLYCNDVLVDADESLFGDGAIKFTFPNGEILNVKLSSKPIVQFKTQYLDIINTKNFTLD